MLIPELVLNFQDNARKVCVTAENEHQPYKNVASLSGKTSNDDLYPLERNSPCKLANAKVENAGPNYSPTRKIKKRRKCGKIMHHSTQMMF